MQIIQRMSIPIYTIIHGILFQKILCGKIENVEYEESSSGNEYFHHHIENKNLAHGYFVKYIGKVKLLMKSKKIYSCGETYNMDHKKLHMIRIPKSDTDVATLFIQGIKHRDYSESFSTKKMSWDVSEISSPPFLSSDLTANLRSAIVAIGAHGHGKYRSGALTQTEAS